MKKLLFSLMFAGISAVTLNAQVWDLADTTTFPDASIVVPTTINGLKFSGASGSSAFAITSNSVTFGDNFAATKRFQFGGNSYSGSSSPAVGSQTMPTKKWVEVAVPTNSVLKIWARGGGARNVLISDNTGTVLSSTAFAGNTTADIAVISYTYAGSAPYLIISSGVGDNYIYKIEVSAGTLAVSGFKSGIKATAFSAGNTIHVRDLESKNTHINVYSANGTLVKTTETSTDTSFDIGAKGVYIVNVKSDAGEKSVKVMIK